MVQDMYNPEYYIGAYKQSGMDKWVTTKYTDDGPTLADAETSIWERRVLYCVPVPGESGWARGMQDAAGAGRAPELLPSGGASKRGRDGDADDDMADADADAPPTQEAAPAASVGGLSAGEGAKRQHTERAPGAVGQCKLTLA